MCNSSWITPHVKQIWIVSSIILAMLGQGMVIGYTTSLLPALQALDSPIKIDIETSSWLVASLGIGYIIGYILSAYFMFAYGRRIAFALDLLPGILGLLLTYFATDISTLIAGRCLNGLTAGSTPILGAIVVGEYTSPKQRGMFMNIKTAMSFMGSMIVHILGNYCHWRTICILNMVPYIMSLIMVYTWPESPAWLVAQKNIKSSEKAFYWLRGHSEESKRELEELIKAQEENFSVMIRKTVLYYALDFCKKFTRKDFIKPVMTYLFAAILLETSGRHIFPAYASEIVKEVTENESQSFYYTLSIDLIITGSAFVSSGLVRMMKRRTLLFTTGIASLVILILTCLYLFLSSIDIISKDRSWIPLVTLAVFFVLVNFGCSLIPLLIIGEIFPLAHRAVGSTIAGILISVCMTITFKVMPFMLLNFKIYGTFAVLALCMAISLSFLYVMLPETKDKTLQQIEDYYNYGRFRVDDKVRGDDEEVDLTMINKSEPFQTLALINRN